MATTVKERFNNHPVSWIGALIVAAFASGWTANAEFRTEPAPLPKAQCVNTEIGQVTGRYNLRLEQLQAELASLENSALRTRSEEEYQRYVEGADRLRHDIRAERHAFESSLQTLEGACRG